MLLSYDSLCAADNNACYILVEDRAFANKIPISVLLLINLNELLEIDPEFLKIRARLASPMTMCARMYKHYATMNMVVIAQSKHGQPKRLHAANTDSIPTTTLTHNRMLIKNSPYYILLRHKPFDPVKLDEFKWSSG